jgi:hypothetical protein
MYIYIYLYIRIYIDIDIDRYIDIDDVISDCLFQGSNKLGRRREAAGAFCPSLNKKHIIVQDTLTAEP